MPATSRCRRSAPTSHERPVFYLVGIVVVRVFLEAVIVFFTMAEAFTGRR